MTTPPTSFEAASRAWSAPRLSKRFHPHPPLRAMPCPAAGSYRPDQERIVRPAAQTDNGPREDDRAGVSEPDAATGALRDHGPRHPRPPVVGLVRRPATG